MSWYRFGSRRVQQRERAEEMRAHLEMYAEELVARGWSQDAARREARLKFGNPRVKLEEVDAISPLANLDQILLDLRYAVRGLLACPAFTAVVLAVLALGIGTTTAIFSVVDAVVLRGLPFREAHRLVAVWSTRVSEGSRPLPLSLPDVVDYRRLQDVFEGLAATTGLAVTLHDSGQAEPLRGARVTADLFEILRVGPEVGRVFTAEHEGERQPQRGGDQPWPLAPAVRGRSRDSRPAHLPRSRRRRSSRRHARGVRLPDRLVGIAGHLGTLRRARQ